MPWVYSVSSGTPPSYTWTGVNTLNQHVSKVTIPSGTRAITKLKVYAAGRSSGVSTRLVLWAVAGSALRQSSTFTMAVGSESPGGQAWHEKSISYYATSGGDFWVGLYRNPSGGHIAGTVSSGGDAFRKTNTSSFPAVSTMSGYSTHSGREMYVGAFYISSPSAPSSCSVSRNSDTSQTISWNRTASDDAPISGFKIYRYDNITESYYLLKTISGSYTTSGSNSYTDTSTSSDAYYKYKILAYNDAGNSSYSNEDDINTTPLDPGDVEAARNAGNVEVWWNDQSSNAQYYKVQRRTSSDGITWSSYSTLTSTISPGTEEYIDTSPANYNQYKVSCTVSNPSLESGETESNQVVILQAPDAPTLLDPDGNEVFDATNSKRFSWQHNPNDDSAQTKYSLQYKVSGGSYPGTPQYNEVSSTNEYVDITGSTFTNGNDYVYQVKTWGDYATGSDWSTEATFKATSTPVAVITSPTAVSDYVYSSLTLSWSYTQAESNNQIQYLAKLYDSSDVLLESKSVTSSIASGASDSCTFDYTLENNTSYKCTLQVKEEDGLWSEETDVTFATVFLQPTTPTFELSFNETNGTMSIDITNPDVVTEYTEESQQDTYDSSYNTTTIYNGNGNLNLFRGSSTVQTVYLDFDLSFFIGKTIVSAKIVLNRKTTLTPGISTGVIYITSSWDENTLNYNTRPTTDSTIYDEHTHSSGDNEEWDITSLVEDIADETITDYYGFAIRPSTTDLSIDYFYDSTNSGNEPYMVIEIEPINAETDHNIIYRSVDGSTWEVVANDVPKNTIVTDYIPGLGNNNNYYVEAVSASNASAFSAEVDLDVEHTGYYYLNAGESFSSYVGLIGDNDITENYEQDTILNRYEGRTFPVKYQGSQTFHNISFTSEILNEYVDSMKTLISTISDTFYRDYEGRYFKCAITSPSFKKESNTSYKFHCIITKVEDV